MLGLNLSWFKVYIFNIHTERGRDSPPVTKEIYAKPTGGTILSGGRLKLHLFRVYSEGQARATDQEKETKSSLLERKKSKFSVKMTGVCV